MAQTKEGKFYSKVREDIKKMPSTKITKIQQVGRVGDMDIVLCVNGHYVEIEMKKDGKTCPEPLQMWSLQEANRCRGYGFIAFPAVWDELYKLLLWMSGTDIPRLEVPRCLLLRPIKSGPRSSPMLVSE